MQVLRERCYRALNRFIPSDITQVLTLTLGNTVQPDTAVDEYQFTYLSANEVRAYSNDSNSELKPEMASLIDEKQARCFAIIHNGSLAAYTWVAAGTIAPEHNCGGSQFLGIGFLLPDNVAYIFKVLVLPAHRGKKLNGWMLYKLSKDLRAEGVEQFITTTDWTNYAFLSSAAKTGFQQIALAGEFILGSRHFYKLPDVGIQGLELVGGGKRRLPI